jgi:adenylate cyclase
VATARRLAAIMFTDMVGSTSAAQVNEAGALRLRDEQEALVRPLFATHQGREIKSMGDGFLAEFDSALRAVECAIDIQERMHERNSHPGVVPMYLRIGVHLGDVEARGSDIVGDSVNLASRVEPQAEPGGVCITEPVFGQVRNKIPNRIEKLEKRTLKDIRFPIDIYKVTMPWEQTASLPVVFDRRRVAVLPLVNLISDPEEEYFADGITEEIISAISRVRELEVISRTSASRFKKTTKRAGEIGRELNVGTLLEGSVRKAGNRVRIAVQLIDANSDKHLWAENYDRTLEDVFSIQSEIAQNVASMLKVTLLDDDRRKLERVPTKDPEAHALFLKGRAAKTWAESAELYQRATDIDPRYALAYAWLAIGKLMMGFFDAILSLEAANEGEAIARQALALEPALSEAHAALGIAQYLRWDFDGAELEMDRAIELDPSFIGALHFKGFLLRLRRRFVESEKFARRGLELDPLSPDSLIDAATDLLYLDRPDEAIGLYRTVLAIDPKAAFARGNLGVAYVRKGMVEEGIEAIRESVRMSSGFDVGKASDLAYALGKGRRTAELRALLVEALEWHEKNARGAYSVAAIYANLGERDLAFTYLDKAIQEHSGYLPNLVFDFVFESLQSDPRMEKIKGRLGLS